MKFALPGKKFLILILALALVNPVNYLVMSQTAPHGTVFLGYVDDAFQLALMKSVMWGFHSPWDFGILVFQNPILGASYTFAVLGTIPELINANLFAVFMAIKFVLSLAYLILVYNVIKFFVKSGKQSNIAFAIFLLSSGAGWIIYAASAVLFPHYAPVVGYAFTGEFEELGIGASALAHLTRIYWLLPEITGLLSLLLFANKKRAASGLLLGLTLLFYPTFAVGFAALIIIYSIMENYGDAKLIKLLAKIVTELLPVAAVSFVFALPWLANYITSPLYFSEYAQWYSADPLVKLLITFALTFTAALYGFMKSTDSLLKNGVFFLAFALVGAASSLMHIYEISAGNTLLREWLVSTNLAGISSFLLSNQIIIDLVLAALFAALFVDVLRRPIRKDYKFVVLWIIGITAMTVVSAKLVFWWPARMQWFLLIPMSIASVAGIDFLSKKSRAIKLTPLKVAAIIILLSLPSLVGFNFYMQKVAHDSGVAYVSKDDYAAMNFLAGLPDGRVLSSYQIGNNIPYYTSRKALLFNGAMDSRMSDYLKFFAANATDSERTEILDTYKIDYVFFGDNEKGVSSNTLVLDNEPFLKIAYGGATKVYSVIRQ